MFSKIKNPTCLYGILVAVHLVYVCLLVPCKNATISCVFKVDGKTFDGSHFSSSELIYEFNGDEYLYTPCRDAISCGESQYMAAWGKNEECDRYLAAWDSTIDPTYSSSHGGTFTFDYKNGETGDQDCPDTNREWKVSFVCDDSESEETYSGFEVTQKSNCVFEATVDTHYACVSGSSSIISNLSVGSIFLICLAGIVFLYCILGYGWSVYKHKKDGDTENGGWTNVKTHTPHVDFWCTLPSYVKVGCIFSKEFCVGAYHKYIKKDTSYQQQLSDANDDM